MNIILAGNPNVGKSTLFNGLTGLRQHTGNWSGKTVDCAVGTYSFNDEKIVVEDIPGCYSLAAKSSEETIAKIAICMAGKNCVAVVCDAHALERNMNLVLQICEAASNVVVGINFVDEALKKGISVDIEKLESILKVPVVRINARKKQGFENLVQRALTKKHIRPFRICYGKHIEKAIAMISAETKKLLPCMCSRYAALRLLENDEWMWEFAETKLSSDKQGLERLGEVYSKAVNYLCRKGIRTDELGEKIAKSVSGCAGKIFSCCVKSERREYSKKEIVADKILTGKISGFLIMLLMLGVIFFITLKLSNYISDHLAGCLFSFEDVLANMADSVGLPIFLKEMLVFGGYRVLAWVVAVMLPPMAIFFPLFTILEDVGYLPRVAFNLDRAFKKCKACGKQALTTCMGFGCNAVGITGARIIDSPRERLVAVLTNVFIPCNGRFPALICLISIFMASGKNEVSASLWLLLFISLGVAMSLLASFVLSHTLLKGVTSSFALELPRFRKPQIGHILVRSLITRTLKVLWRAVVVAFPSGILLWLASNVSIDEKTIVSYVISFFEPLGRIMGLDGVILTAFLLGISANEIVLPVALMLYSAGESLVADVTTAHAASILASNGWNTISGICAIIFFIMHWPCATSLLTVKKETGSFKWAFVSFVLPSVFGIAVCAFVNYISKIFL